MRATITTAAVPIHVNEVFLEVGIPLLNDSFWGKADLDLGGRHARYSHGR